MSFLRLDRQGRNRPRLQPLQADGVAGLLTVTVTAVFDASQCGIDLRNQLALTVPGTQLDGPLRLRGRAVRKVGGQIVFAILNDGDWGVLWYGGDSKTAAVLVEDETEEFPSDAVTAFLKHLPSRIGERDLAPYPAYVHWARAELRRRVREIENVDLKSLAPEDPDAKEVGQAVYGRRRTVRNAMEVIRNLTQQNYPDIAELVTPFVLHNWTTQNSDMTEELRACIKALSAWCKETGKAFDPGSARHMRR